MRVAKSANLLALPDVNWFPNDRLEANPTLLAPQTKPMLTLEDETNDLPAGRWWSQLLDWALRPRILGALALAMLFVVVIPSIPALWPTVSRNAKFQMSVDRIDLTPATRWTPHDIVENVAKSHPEWKDRSLLESNLAADLAAAFSEHPWISKVDRVEKTRQGRVIVQVTYRTPVAMIETHRGLYPVDTQGVLLPPNDFSLAESDQLPHLRQIRTMPSGRAGTVWGDPLVVSGAKLCAALMPEGNLESHWERYGLEALVAPSTPLDNAEIAQEPPVFELLTQGGRRIIWGRPPGDDSLEPTVAQKLGRLDSYIRQQKSLDQPVGAYRIDIRGFNATRLLVEKPGTGILR